MRLEAEILRKLKHARGFVSGQRLAEELSVSRMAVWKAVERLKAEGYRIEAKAKKGYRLVNLKSDLLNAMEIQHELGTKTIGGEVFCLKESESTMDEVRRLSSRGEGLTVIAERQTCGRGRLGRSWHSPSGGIYLSILLKPKIQPQKVPCLSLLGGLAAAETLRSLYRVDARLKWPNDVVCGEKKLCGVLVEASVEHDIVHYAILGVGVNLNVAGFPRSLRGKACSIQMLLERKVSRLEFVREFLRRLDGWYQVFLREGCRPVVEAWSRLSATLGRKVEVKLPRAAFRGVAEALDEDGALILRLPKGGRVKVFAGTLRHLPEQ